MSQVFVPTPRPDRGLTAAQRKALLTMREGVETDAPTLAEATGMRPNGAALALRGLERRGLVARQEGEPASWTVTFAGHALAQRLLAANEGPPDLTAAQPDDAPPPGTRRSGRA